MNKLVNYKVAIIDYGMGNVQSIKNAIEHVSQCNVILTNNKNEIKNADCLILPGVGAFPDAMKKLESSDLISLLNKEVLQNNKPILGICLGMQLLFNGSDEIINTQGLGWIPGHVEYMKPKRSLRVPHVGWNELNIKKENSLFSFLERDKNFYFVHSLYVKCDAKYVLATFEYGNEMTAAVQLDNVVGMQFHPEKSQKVGLDTLNNFLQWAYAYTTNNGIADA